MLHRQMFILFRFLRSTRRLSSRQPPRPGPKLHVECMLSNTCLNSNAEPRADMLGKLLTSSASTDYSVLIRNTALSNKALTVEIMGGVLCVQKFE
jgi:hypothetical protein